MSDAEWIAVAAMVCTTLVSISIPITATIIKFVPSKNQGKVSVDEIIDVKRRIGKTETHVAVLEANYLNIGAMLKEMKEELHAVKKLLLDPSRHSRDHGK